METPSSDRVRARVMTVPSPAGGGADLDGLILAIARDADRQAFAALFRHFAPRLKSYLSRTGLPANAAEELAQETMLAVWRKASYFDPARAGAATWVFTIARNLRIDLLRRERHRSTFATEADAEPVDETSGETVLMTAEREARVRAALSALSEEQAAIVRLSFFQEKPHSAIAQELGIPLGTAKSRVRLALARLRVLLEDLK
jgi:RNA polymerase sigma-70 factor (ECF subfamily)